MQRIKYRSQRDDRDLIVSGQTEMVTSAMIVVACLAVTIKRLEFEKIRHLCISGELKVKRIVVYSEQFTKLQVITAA